MSLPNSGVLRLRPIDSALQKGSIGHTAATHAQADSVNEWLGMVLIAGPCLLESVEHGWRMANALIEIIDRVGVNSFYFKASWRKANRTHYDAARQMVPYLEAQALFERIETELGLDCTTDVHDVEEARMWFPDIHMLQIPAMLSRQTDLIEAAAGAGQELVATMLNIKKSQGMHPQDMRWAVEKAKHVNSGCLVMVTERGTTFGYDDLIVDTRSFSIMKECAGADWVLFDATHSSNYRGAIDGLARAAIVSGADGLFVEVHDDVDHALSDGARQIPLKHFEEWLKPLIELYEWQQQYPLKELEP